MDGTAEPGLLVWCEVDKDAGCQTGQRHPHWPRPRHLPLTRSRRTAHGRGLENYGNARSFIYSLLLIITYNDMTKYICHVSVINL